MATAVAGCRTPTNARVRVAGGLGTIDTRTAGGDPSTIDGPAVTKAAHQGDPMSLRILERVGVRLGEGIAGLVNVLDADVVVVGGGAAAAGDLLLEPARRAFVDAVEAADHRPAVPILAAALGNDAGAIGAADLARAEAGRVAG